MDPKVNGARTEEEITRNWKYPEPPLVSIRCTTYNHEPYIRDAIEGFLMQETDFPFEIVIHDDASTDGTADIIREYEKRYPNLIKPIYQVENQYSKGGGGITRILNKKMRGEYVAICEGDDYWTDPRKLQIQIDEMREYPECDICFHSATMAYQDNSRPGRVVGKPRKESGIIPLGEVIRGGGGFMPTASIVLGKSIPENLPDWYYTTAPIGDLFWQIYGTKRGGALFIDRNMAVYRAMVPGSWSKDMQDVNNYQDSIKRIQSCLEMAKEELEKNFHKDVDYLIAEHDVLLAISFLKEKITDGFEQSIINSWGKYPRSNIRQIFLYTLKKIPLLAYYFCGARIFFRGKLSKRKIIKVRKSDFDRLGEKD